MLIRGYTTLPGRAVLVLCVAAVLRLTAAAYVAPAELVLGALFPRSGWPVGESCHAAAQIAIDEVNANTALLPSTKIKHFWNDTLEADVKGVNGTLLGQTSGQYATDDNCDASMGVNIVVQQKAAHPEIVGFIGSGCSGVCMPVSKMAAGWKTPLVAWGCSSPTLSDAKAYPWFTRTVFSDGVVNKVLTQDYFKPQGIKKVGVMMDDTGFCSGTVKDFQGQLATIGASVIHTTTWKQKLLTYNKAIQLITEMVEKNVKVFYTCNYAEDDIHLKQAFSDLGINTDPSVLLVPIWPYPWSLLPKDTTAALYKKRLPQILGWVVAAPVAPVVPSMTKFLADYKLKTSAKYDSFCAHAYEAVYAFAYAAQRCITAQVKASGRNLRKELLATNFDSITGKVQIESNGDRKTVNFEISKLVTSSAAEGYGKSAFLTLDAITGAKIDPAKAPPVKDAPVCKNGDSGLPCSGNSSGTCIQVVQSKKVVPVCSCRSGYAGTLCSSTCHSKNGKSDFTGKCICVSTRWSGSSCSTEIKENRNLITPALKLLGMLMFAINAACCVCLCIWVAVKNDTPQIKGAQPFFLYLILLGCLVSSSTILALSQENTSAGCTMFPALYSIGFCITFGSLFSKILRVHLIFKSAKKLQKKQVTVTQTATVIASLIAVDIAILAIWMAQDPLKWVREIKSKDVFGHVLSSAGYCHSPTAGTYIGLIAALHFAVLTYASYLCYKTRHIPSRFAEGKYLSLAMASNLEVMLLGVPVLIIVGNQPSTGFFVRSAIIFLNDFAVLGFIFGNLVYSVYWGEDDTSEPLTGRTAKKAKTTKSSASAKFNVTNTASKENAVMPVSIVQDVVTQEDGSIQHHE